MNTRKECVAHRWEKLMHAAEREGLGRYRICDLAGRSGLTWFASRGEEPLANYLGKDGRAIFLIPGFGRKKIIRLCEILENLPNKVLEIPNEELSVSSPRQTLESWNIPHDFPCNLVALPIRLLHYCGKNNIAGLFGLLEEWERLGFYGMKSVRNLGKKTVKELETLVMNLEHEDRQGAALFIPLCPSGNGVDFAASLEHLLAEPSPPELVMLEQRLVERLTLEECSDVRGLTRERTRQVEAKFLGQVQRRLDYFADLRERMLDAWVNSGDWFSLVKWQGTASGAILARAALEAIFRDCPHGVARELAQESRLEELEELIESEQEFWFGGVLLAEFLANIQAEGERNAFCVRLTETSRFRLDQTTGRVHPGKTTMRQVAEAMVAGEDDPMPLTWLIELMRKTGYYPNLEKYDLLRRRAAWRKEKIFPDEMVLWRE